MKPLDPPCIKWKPALVGLLDGELTAAERTALEAHVASCPGCHADLADLQAMSAFLRRQEPVEPRRNLWERISDTEAPFRHHAAPSRRRVPFVFGGRLRDALLPAGLGAALAAAAVACIFHVRPPASPASNEVRALAADVAELRAELARTEAALVAARELAAAPAASTTQAPAATAPASMSSRVVDDAFLAEINRRIADSEARQDAKFLFTTDQLARSLSLQRRDDLAEIDRDLRDVRAETFQALVTTHERLDRLARPAVLDDPALEPDLPVTRDESRSNTAGGGGKPKDERLEPRW
jgi:hypothetical protein